MQTRRILPVALALLGLSPAAAFAAPVTIPEGVADAIMGQGTGLCAASAIATNPNTDFGLINPDAYRGSINGFIEVHKVDRVESVIRTLLDLSNNNSSGLKLSYGDFVDAALPDCKTGGCDFFVTDATTAFGSRLRGYFNVTQDLVGQPIHFGFYTDDAVTLSIFGGNQPVAEYEVVTRPAAIGAPTWRVTEQVTFGKAGLYPIEILYIEITEHAALEMSYFIGNFTDFERPANQPPIVKLNDAGFTLFPPTSFFQTLSGNPSYADLTACQQCNRADVNKPGNSTCGNGYYCNDAALCAPCDTAKLCGPSCSPCGGDSPFCVNLNGNVQCAGCRYDSDCQGGFTCDPLTKTCNECNENTDCPKGEACIDNNCAPCATSDACAGNSCNCCPTGQFGTQMKCEALDPNSDPSCVECTSDADCAGFRCNTSVGVCVAELPENITPDKCGDNQVNCLQLETIVINGAAVPRFPFCLPGPVGNACAECRHDMDCADGAFCLSGECTPCTRDKRCGMRCDTCGGDTPYCNGQSAATASCVRCNDDAQCNGGTCDLKTNTCAPASACNSTCAPATPYCDGTSCVACYADSQCPCGGTCNAASKTCTPACKTNVDCLGNEHCRWTDDETTKECALGPMPDGVDCGGTLATICSARPGRHGGGAPGAAFIALSILALWGRRTRRGQL